MSSTSPAIIATASLIAALFVSFAPDAAGAVETIETRRYTERFLGGRGLATAIYWNEVSPEIDALDPRNRLIISLGPLAGIPAVGGSRRRPPWDIPFHPGVRSR